MFEKGILNGDYVVVARNVEVRNGDIAAVRIDDEATVKMVYRDGRHVRLVPANPAYEPIVLEEDGRDVDVIGKVVGLIRSYSTGRIRPK
jgi:repressor LexA